MIPGYEKTSLLPNVPLIFLLKILAWISNNYLEGETSFLKYIVHSIQ